MPNNTETIDLQLVVQIADDHKSHPLSNKYTVEIAVLEKVDAGESNSTEPLNKLQRDRYNYLAKLPPPVITIGTIDDNNQIAVSFDRPVGFQLHGKRRLLDGKELNPSREESLSSFTNLQNLNSQNEGAELFSISYNPSMRSQMIQSKLAEFDVEISWKIILTNSTSFSIQVNFTQPELVSYYPD